MRVEVELVLVVHLSRQTGGQTVINVSVDINKCICGVVVIMVVWVLGWRAGVNARVGKGTTNKLPVDL